MGGSAFEPQGIIFSKNFIFLDPSSIPFDFYSNWGRIEAGWGNFLNRPQLYQESKGIEAGWKIFLFSKNISHELSNALPPMSFGPIVAEISCVEVSKIICDFQFFQNLYIFAEFSMDFGWFFHEFWKNWKSQIILLTSTHDISATIGPNDMGGSAFESSWLIFFENKKIFHPASIPLDSWYNWGRFKKYPHPSSILPQLLQRSKGIEEGWGKLKFLESMGAGGSNALPPMYFGPIVAEKT